jgi:Fusaric acid resistance protein family
MALLSALAAFIAIVLASAIWIATAWPEGSAAPMLAAVGASFFAAQDDPAPQIVHTNAGLIGAIGAGIYLFAVLPVATSFEMLALALAPALIACGLLMTQPRTGLLGLGIGVVGSDRSSAPTPKHSRHDGANRHRARTPARSRAPTLRWTISSAPLRTSISRTQRPLRSHPASSASPLPMRSTPPSGAQQKRCGLPTAATCRPGRGTARNALRDWNSVPVLLEDKEPGAPQYQRSSSAMCDYSLHHVKSRPAKVGDKLRTVNFNTGTRGFAAPDDPTTAVCVLPGTELAFAEEVKCAPAPFSLSAWKTKTVNFRTAIFRQVNKDVPRMHHDALEFPDGQTVLLTELVEGQKVTVLQLPAQPKTPAEEAAQRRVTYVG